MPIFRYFTVAGSALLALLFVSAAVFGDDSDGRFDGTLFENATYAPRPEETVMVAELRFTHDATAADHVREVFGQFVASDGRRAKR
jgi:hypothetical protein